MNDPRPVAHPTAQPAHPQQPVHPQPRPLQAPHAVQPAPGLRPPQQQASPIARPMGAPGLGSPQVRPAGAPGQMPHAPAAQPQGLPRQGSGTVINPAQHKPVDDEPVALIEDADEDDLAPAATSTASKIKFGADLGVKKHDWKRQTKMLGNGPTRVKTFHAKLSDQGLEYLDEAINVFIDEHPDVDVKFVTTNVGMFDGKFKDLALVVNVWY